MVPVHGRGRERVPSSPGSLKLKVRVPSMPFGGP